MNKLQSYLLLVFISTLFFSCNDEELFDDEDQLEEEAGVPDIILENCLYSDLNVQANSTITIDCLLDLEGQTIEVPSGVVFEFDGGDIFNGTLNFLSDGQIAGELLNSKLTILGSAELIGSNFEFKPSRWDIIEGEVTSEVAENNKIKMNELLIFIKSLVTETPVDFVINNLDAYFKVDGYDSNNNPSIREGIVIPSDYNLILSDTAYLRMYPNDNRVPALIFIGDGVENITITGGNFVGERDEHDYSQGAQEWGHLLRVGGANNIRISEAEFVDAMGDGIDVHGFGHSFDPHHIPSTEVYIVNNTFRRNRRNQISVTSGNQIYIEDNNFIDGSIHTEDSQGVAPGFAIDVEAYRANGLEFEIAEDIYIRNNTESGSRICLLYTSPSPRD